MRTEPHAAGKSIPATAHSCNRTDKCHRYCFGRTLRRNGTDGRTISAHAQHRKDKSQSRAARAAIRKDMGERKERRSTDRKKTVRSPDHHAVRPSIRSDGRPAVQPFGRSLDRSPVHPFIQSAVKRADGQTGEKSRTKREQYDRTARVNAVNVYDTARHAYHARRKNHVLHPGAESNGSDFQTGQ